MFTGDFEIHLTGSQWQVDELGAFAAGRAVKFTHIELHRGVTTSQPMITVTGTGELADMHALVGRWRAELVAAGLHVLRVKIEAAPWNDGVPVSDVDARGDLYFEHHVKVLHPAGSAAIEAVLRAVAGHHAHVSRNARRGRERGLAERFVTQRCHGVGRKTARAQLDALLTSLREQEIDVLEVEEEYVVHDDARHVDDGWLESDLRTAAASAYENRARSAPAGVEGYSATYRPLAVRPGQDIRQRAAFDPALKQFSHAYRPGEPTFGDAAAGERWLLARRAAMAHVLALVAASPWAENLVLRGSVVLRAWFGDAAREPGDLDFVVTPATTPVDSQDAEAMLAGIIAAVEADPGPGLRADQAVSEYIWTYERVPGRRLVFPFDVEDLPQGAVQLDVVFNEPLPEPPITVEIPPLDTRVRAATPRLALAWKLDWLVDDMYPQGKDLYDAVLLAEHVAEPLSALRELMNPDAVRALDHVHHGDLTSLQVDWPNFLDEHPATPGDAQPWLTRLATALGRDT